MYTYVKKIYKHLWENEHLGSRSKFVPEAAIIKSIRKSQLNIYIPVIYHSQQCYQDLFICLEMVSKCHYNSMKMKHLRINLKSEMFDFSRKAMTRYYEKFKKYANGYGTPRYGNE